MSSLLGQTANGVAIFRSVKDTEMQSTELCL